MTRKTLAAAALMTFVSGCAVSNEPIFSKNRVQEHRGAPDPMPRMTQDKYRRKKKVRNLHARDFMTISRSRQKKLLKYWR